MPSFLYYNKTVLKIHRDVKVYSKEMRNEMFFAELDEFLGIWQKLMLYQKIMYKYS